MSTLELLPMWAGVEPDVELFFSGAISDDMGEWAGGQALQGTAEEGEAFVRSFFVSRVAEDLLQYHEQGLSDLQHCFHRYNEFCKGNMLVLIKGPTVHTSSNILESGPSLIYIKAWCSSWKLIRTSLWSTRQPGQHEHVFQSNPRMAC